MYVCSRKFGCYAAHFGIKNSRGSPSFDDLRIVLCGRSRSCSVGGGRFAFVSLIARAMPVLGIILTPTQAGYMYVYVHVCTSTCLSLNGVDALFHTNLPSVDWRDPSYAMAPLTERSWPIAPEMYVEYYNLLLPEN